MKIEAKDGWSPDMSRIDELTKQIDDLAPEHNAYAAERIRGYTVGPIKNVTAALDATKDKQVISDIRAFLGDVEEGRYFEPYSTKQDTFFTDAAALIERATGEKPLPLYSNEEMSDKLNEAIGFTWAMDGPGIVQVIKDNDYDKFVESGVNMKNVHSKYMCLQRKLDKAIKHAENQVKMHNIHVDKKLSKATPMPDFVITDNGDELCVAAKGTAITFTGEDREQFISEATATVGFEDKLIEKQTPDLTEAHNAATVITEQYKNIFDSIAIGRGSELSKDEKSIVSAVYKNEIAWKKCVRDFVEGNGSYCEKKTKTADCEIER